MAHLRGLLRPDYPLGRMSVLREGLVMRALAQEMDAHKESDMAMMEAILVSASQASTRSEAYRRLAQDMQDARMRLEFSPVTYRPELINLASSAKLYYALEEAGFLDAPEDESDE